MRCNDEIFRNGVCFLLIGDYKGRATDIEEWKDRLVDMSGLRIDWHFFAGRARFLVIGNASLAAEYAESIIGDIANGAYQFYA